MNNRTAKKNFAAWMIDFIRDHKGRAFTVQDLMAAGHKPNKRFNWAMTNLAAHQLVELSTVTVQKEKRILVPVDIAEYSVSDRVHELSDDELEALLIGVSDTPTE